MLSFHVLVIAAIFVPYLALMTGLIAYACWTGRDPRDDPPDAGEDGSGPVPAVA